MNYEVLQIRAWYREDIRTANAKLKEIGVDRAAFWNSLSLVMKAIEDRARVLGEVLMSSDVEWRKVEIWPVFTSFVLNAVASATSPEPVLVVRFWTSDYRPLDHFVG